MLGALDTGPGAEFSTRERDDRRARTTKAAPRAVRWTTLRAVRLAPWVIVLVGCQGTTVEVATDAGDGSVDVATEASSDVASETAPDTAADAATCNVPNNLVLNPSFEVATDTAVANWPAALKPKTGGAHDCERWVEWRTEVDWELVAQGFSLGEEAPVGASYEVAAWVKTLDGNTEPFALYFEGAKDDYAQQLTGVLRTEWTRVSAVFTLAKPTTTAMLALRQSGPGLRALAIDLVSVRRL